MLVFPIRYPGTWLDVADHDNEWRVHGIIRVLEHHATDAFVSVNLFLPERIQSDRDSRHRIRDAERAERNRVEAELRAELGEARYHADSAGIREEVERRSKSARWARGEVPRSYAFQRAFIFAHAFLYAVDGFAKSLALLAADAAVSNKLSESVETFSLFFAGVKDVRDSAHHVEDRSRGLDRKGKALDLKPIVNGVINASGVEVLMLGVLVGDRLTYTASSGQPESIAVSAASARQVQVSFQAILDALPWKGPARWLPD
jgi:hypothetical protein